ncbi:hypothetical protein Mapa_015534 [Marchantia paleacea]|nr:hypothetical protein Mapa_015534 [Marchantia paleacea]
MYYWILLVALANWPAVRAVKVQTSTPPRGWNSYDSFSWLVTEREFLQNAQFVSQHLSEFGYEYVVVDFLWFRKNDGVATFDQGKDLVDAWGRPQPDPERWPSSRGGVGFKAVADQVHAMKLKFGIHVMRGISTAALEENRPILGAAKDFVGGHKRTGATSRDIALEDQPCPWMPQSFVGVNVSDAAGRLFILSLYRQFADWGVDYVKHDCVFGINLQLDEIQTVSEVIASLERPMLYSVSPGIKATTNLAQNVKHLVNTYRVTVDSWDNWADLVSHFDVASDFVGAGLLKGSWPDLDMLPLGRLTDPSANQVSYRQCRLTRREQVTMLTLWAMAKSPLFYGGDLRYMDPHTWKLITNKLMLYINANSFNNREVNNREITGSVSKPTRVWTANGPAGETFVSISNLGDQTISLHVHICQIYSGGRNGRAGGDCMCTGVDIWSGESLRFMSSLQLSLPPHASSLLSLQCTGA